MSGSEEILTGSLRSHGSASQPKHQQQLHQQQQLYYTPTQAVGQRQIVHQEDDEIEIKLSMSPSLNSPATPTKQVALPTYASLCGLLHEQNVLLSQLIAALEDE